MPNKRVYVIAAATSAIGVLLLAPGLGGEGPNFIADYIFKGSSLTGWHVLGHADWKAQNGEIIGTPKQAGGGGWLVLDKSFAEVAFYADVHCTAGCKTGVLFRAEKTPDGGMKGVYVSLTEGDVACYAVKLDAHAREISREKLPTGNSEGGLRSSGGNTPSVPQAASDRSVVLPLPPGVDLPGLPQGPKGAYHAGDWNQVGVILYGDMLKPALNDGPSGRSVDLARSIAAETAGKYGPVALYVGGSGEVRFKDIRYSDLLGTVVPLEHVSSNFRVQRLSPFYFSLGTAVADINHDGIPDVIAGEFYYLGPDYTIAREFETPSVYNPGSEYSQVSILNFAYDFTGDGWPDILLVSGNGGYHNVTLYVNPKGEARHWDKYVVLGPIGNESVLLKDIDGDGKLELIHTGAHTLQYSKPDPANPTGKWITKTISEQGPWGAYIGHGLGVGDMNGDGLMDYVTLYGWFEQPPKGSSQQLWTYHPQRFGRWGEFAAGAGGGGGEMGVYDVNGDGLNDVVTALDGNGFGLAWYEQKRDASGKTSFVEHIIMDNYLTKNPGDVTITAPHDVGFADMDGDGIPDLITGKRPLAHLFSYDGADPFGTPVLYWYRTVRNPKAPGGAEFVPELVHNHSGVGGHLTVTDLNGDGRPDIVTSGSVGTFIFFNNIKPRTDGTPTPATSGQ